VENRKTTILKHTDLDVFKRSFDAAMTLFELSKKFPAEERFSLTDQCRRSSRSVCANLAEVWRKRRYPAAFISKLSDSEAADTQTWIQFAVKTNYLTSDEVRDLYAEYDNIIGMIVNMIKKTENWTLK